MEEKATLTKYYADWCQPCRTLSVIMRGMVYDEVDVESEEGGAQAKHYGVRSLPTLVLTDYDGETISTLVGLRSRQEISGWLEDNGASYLG